MKDEEFNKYCAEVMGYKQGSKHVIAGYWTWIKPYGTYIGQSDYQPATDLNQMAEVFDKLLANERIPKAFTVFSGQEIAQAMREFIESTKS